MKHKVGDSVILNNKVIKGFEEFEGRAVIIDTIDESIPAYLHTFNRTMGINFTFDDSYIDEEKTKEYLEKKEVVLPEIPDYVADEFELLDAGGQISEFQNINHIIGAAFSGSTVHENSKLMIWVKNNLEDYVIASSIGYVRERKRYYAKIKAWELVDKASVEAYEFDVEQGVDGLPPDSSYHRNVYIIQQRNKDLIIDMKESGLGGATHSMTKKQWNELGINEDNAVFEKEE